MMSGAQSEALHAQYNQHPAVNLLILVTGSVAAIKLGLLLDQLSTEHCHIRIAATNSAFHFLNRAQSSKTGIPFQSILTDEKEWDRWQGMNDAVVHIELRRWADLVVIAPLDANSLAKISTGLCDNLVTCVMRAWEVKEKPVLVCPAMNTAMWTHPATARQLSVLSDWYSLSEPTSSIEDNEPTKASPPPPSVSQPTKVQGTPSVTEDDSSVSGGERNQQQQQQSALPATLSSAMFQVIGPIRKRLACGDVGVGGMASVEEIAVAVRHTMSLIRTQKVRRLSAASSTAATPQEDT